MQDHETLKRRIAELLIEHQSLDTLLRDLAALRPMDELQIRRLKKRKLQIKDTISLLQMQMVPDIPA